MGQMLILSLPWQFLLLVLLCFDEVSGYYCEWDLCGSDQYCCGDNLCCEYVYSLWYFWVGILFVVILLSACGGLFRYCYYNNSFVAYHVSNYSPLPNVGSSDDTESFMVSARQGSSHPYSDQKLPGYPPPPFRDPPPPYSPSVGPPAPPFGSEHQSKHSSDTTLYIYP